MNERILIIDDDIDMCLLLERLFIRNHFEVTICNSGKKSLLEIEKNIPDVILCDFRLPDMDGKELLIKIKQTHPPIPVIIITGYSDIKMAVEVMKFGAFDYVTKPLFPEEIVSSIKSAILFVNGTPDPQTPNDALHSGSRKESESVKYIFGECRELQDILMQIDLVAPTNYSVIISGETGSGKESIALEIHARSKRSNKPFIAIDCGALSKELASSELFGHEKGSFTGAHSQKIGSLELANGGTAFLDEVANLSYEVQVSLLRVVQERKLRRIGGNKDIDLDIRIIVASNELLWDATKTGRFREDLYFRFNEFAITVPPLRHRRNDILIFANFFLEKSNVELNKKLEGFSKEVIQIFGQYKWPGNLRELKNVVKRAALLAEGNFIEVTELPFGLIGHSGILNNIAVESLPERVAIKPIDEHAFIKLETDTPTLPLINQDVFYKVPAHSFQNVGFDAEYDMIMEALKKTKFNKSKAAKLLNIDRRTLYNKLEKYNELKKE